MKNPAEPSPTIQLHLEGEIVPKLRPRVAFGRAYMPQKYRAWKDGAIALFMAQYHGDPLEKVASIAIELTGKHSRRCDSDNVAGALLDALVQAGILKDDNLKVVPSLSIALTHSKDSPRATMTIQP